ncbi:LOW QUALITY PROTEIN: hypothetical protein RJ639_025609 [Escallonia herrerae]|uniref:CCHC-type domain-containing protein n=1 Tax=Escallonia herrerae TaxID=1293975 RepID=A0AA89ACX0_9ASTE|nr:LOW QUALITY PROTEIN: hypothetical protein RJ639_025609 [Escallonia herrerae]
MDDLLQIVSTKTGTIEERGFMRLRINMDIEKAFPKVFVMKREGAEDAWIQYERLPDLCFNCGHLGHVRKWCNIPKDPTEDWNLTGAQRPYNPWIRANYEEVTTGYLF